MSKPLPGAEELLARFVLSEYPDGFERPPFVRDAVQAVYPPGTPSGAAQVLTAEGQEKVAEMRATMLEAAIADAAAVYPGADAPSMELLDAVDRYWSRERVEEFVEECAASEEGSETYRVLCIEIAMLLGEMLIQSAPECAWIEEWPYWESAIYHPPSGTTIHVFDWAIQKLSEEAVEDVLVSKLLACVEMLRSGE